MADGDEGKHPETGLPETNDAGFAMLGDLPYNTRLRAEAMVAQGITSDPHGIVDADLLASTAERLKDEAAARQAEEAAAHPPVTMAMTRDALAEVATAEGVVVDDGHTKADIIDNIQAARPAEEPEA